MLNPIQFDLYDETINQMRKFVASTNLPLEKNPVIKKLNSLKAKKLASCVKEHACFCNEAIHILLEAKLKTYNWPNLSIEIDENIKEEMGLKTNNIPHLELMRYGYKKDLNLETENHRPSKATKVFFKKIWGIFKTNNNAYIAGALLAFEGTAVTEFSVLDKIVKEYLKKSGKVLENGYTKSYIDGHKKFEIDHESRLKLAIKPYINESNVKDFVKGYKDVILAMVNWWKNI